jgi:methylenetetrahydrofolate reductase (NADPH)
MRMIQTNGAKKVLIMGSQPELAAAATQAINGAASVIYAATQQDGWEKIKKEGPDVVILGRLEPAGAAYASYIKLREGWATRNKAVVMVDVAGSGAVGGLLTDGERCRVEAGDLLSLDLTNGAVHQLKEKVDELLKGKVNRLKKAVLDSGSFSVVWEQIPGRGAFESSQEKALENARMASRDGRINAISVTDNPSGNPAIATDALCNEIRRLGIEPLMHIAMRDRNRTQFESLLYQLTALNIRNLLVLTGDYPSDSGFQGRSKPVFDLDSVTALQLVKAMNGGMEFEAMHKKTVLAPTDFFTSVAVSPFKHTEGEVMGQYFKLKKKIEAGADFIITQVGYDVRKFHELLMWLKLNGYHTPALASIYVLSRPAAKVMNANQVAGCVVTDKLLAEIERESAGEDKGKSARLNRAAKQYAIARGMGYAGAYIAGQGLTYENVKFILDKGNELVGNWQSLTAEFQYPQDKGFYFFEKDNRTGLNLAEPAARKASVIRSPIYGFSRVVHAVAFKPRGLVFKVLGPIARLVDKSPLLHKPFGFLEHITKVVLFNCMNCGDCALQDVAYICPMSQCPKNQRNGPCGGSSDGWCEVHPGEKKCIWVKAYGRLKSSGQESTIGNNIVPPCNWQLWQTPSWLNYYSGRDHISKRSGIAGPREKAPLTQ